MKNYQNQSFLYKLENIFIDIFCFCLNDEKNLDDIIFEINFDFELFILEHHQYLIKKLFKEEQKINIKNEELFLKYQNFYEKYKNYYNKKSNHLNKLLEYIDICDINK